MDFMDLSLRKGVVGLATGMGAIYLLYKAIKAGVNCHSTLSSSSPVCIARLAIERERHGKDSGELRRLLNSLECKQDEYSKSMILHSITRCVYLLETEACTCTFEDICLVASQLDDKDNNVKIQALNALKAFSGIRKFRLKIQLPGPCNMGFEAGQSLSPLAMLGDHDGHGDSAGEDAPSTGTLATGLAGRAGSATSYI
ncbi:armadillo repeat-containing protein 12 [Gracilinanus agilis]|uniref:armadillo repeat-containing protein 12 n=1 Tax=Gracilinanus agilis TaxID=191870 RepID=UPI001CFCC5DF|nr:armadillo repeat-containing protein 12 [Gracilinanus agilis]